MSMTKYYRRIKRGSIMLTFKNASVTLGKVLIT
jgi:hypothetical protein